MLLSSNMSSAAVLPHENSLGVVVLPGSNTSGDVLPDSNAVWMIEREKERERAQQARSTAAHTPTPTSDDLSELINRTIEQRLPALIEQLSAGLLRQIAHVAPSVAPVSPPIHPLAGDIPVAPPPGEPPLRSPLLTIWENIIGVPVSQRDTMQIVQLVDRYAAGLAGAFSAYWVGRVMLFADARRDDPAKRIDIKNLNTFLGRMEGACCFSTTALEDRDYGKASGAKSAPAPEPRTAREKAPAATQEADPPVPLQVSAPPAAPVAQNGAPPFADVASQPGDINATDPVALWRSFAGSERGISSAREAELRTIVTDSALWRIVLTNFHERYGAKANWANWDALFDHYRREAAVGTSAAPTLDPRMPTIPSTILYYHPVLVADRELLREWTLRYGEAPNKQAKQEVLRRLVQEYPLPDPLPADLAECLGIAVPASGGAQ